MSDVSNDVSRTELAALYKELELAPLDAATLEALGIPRKTFYDKLQRHGINRADYE